MVERLHRFLIILALLVLTLCEVSAEDPAFAPTPGDAVKTFWGQTEVAKGLSLGRFNLLVVEGSSPQYDFETSHSERYDTLVETLKSCCTTPSPCSSNLKNLDTAIEMYCVDNNGQYPTSLDKLAPVYRKTLPTCPTNHAPYRYENLGGKFIVYCQGNHRGQPKGQPCISSDKGLMMAPDQAPLPTPIINLEKLQWKLVGTQQTGNRAVVRTLEQLSISGHVVEVSVAYRLVKHGKNWYIDPKASAPDLSAELKTLPKAPGKFWQDFIRKEFPRYGFGGLVLSFVRYARKI